MDPVTIGIGARLLGFGKRFWPYIVLAIILAIAVWSMVRWYDAKIKDAENRGYNQAVIDGMKVKQSTDTATSAVTVSIRSKTDEKAGGINAIAERERMSGPGASSARCPRLPEPASGPDAASGNPDDAGDRLPADVGQSVVPWGWLVSRAQTCDLNRNEVLAWREWHDEVVKVWPKGDGK